MAESFKIIWAHRLAIFRFIFYSCVTLVLTWTTATNGVDWDVMSGLEKINLFLGCFATWGTTMIAFMDRTIARLDPSLAPLTNGDKAAIAATVK